MKEIDYAALSMIAIVALFGGVIKILYSSGARGLKEILAIVLVATPVGVLAGYSAFEMGYGISVVSGVAAVCALVADKIVLAILDSADHLPELVKRAMTNWVDKKTK